MTSFDVEITQDDNPLPVKVEITCIEKCYSFSYRTLGPIERAEIDAEKVLARFNKALPRFPGLESL